MSGCEDNGQALHRIMPRQLEILVSFGFCASPRLETSQARFLLLCFRMGVPGGYASAKMLQAGRARRVCFCKDALGRACSAAKLLQGEMRPSQRMLF